MVRKIIIGDVHGCLYELKELIHSLKLKINDQLFFIGDLIDKGPNSLGVVKYVFELSKSYSTILILGNHEEKFLRYLYNKEYNLKALKEMKITNDFSSLATNLSSDEIEFLKKSYYTYSIKEDDILLLHGGITENCKVNFKVNHQYNSQKKIKDLDLITKTRHLDKSGKFVSLGYETENTYFWAERYDGKNGKVIFGHNTFMQSSPKYFPNAIGIDMGCVYGHHLMALIITKNKIEYISTSAKNIYSK